MCALIGVSGGDVQRKAITLCPPGDRTGDVGAASTNIEQCVNSISAQYGTQIVPIRPLPSGDHAIDELELSICPVKHRQIAIRVIHPLGRSFIPVLLPRQYGYSHGLAPIVVDSTVSTLRNGTVAVMQTG